MKFLVICGVIALIIYGLWRKFKRLPPEVQQMWIMLFSAWKLNKDLKKSEKAHAKRQNTQQQTRPEIIRPCTTCGLHIPEKDGILVHDQFYCCQEHVK